MPRTKCRAAADACRSVMEGPLVLETSSFLAKN